VTEAEKVDITHKPEVISAMICDVNLGLQPGSLVIYKVEDDGSAEVQINLKNLVVKSTNLKKSKEYEWDNTYGKKTVSPAYVKEAVQKMIDDIARIPQVFVSHDFVDKETAEKLKPLLPNSGIDHNLFKTLEIVIDIDIDQADREVTFICVGSSDIGNDTWDQVTVQDGVAEVVYHVCLLHGGKPAAGAK
jgi:hypothetical protein